MRKIFVTRKLLKENEDKLGRLLRLNPNDKIWNWKESKVLIIAMVF